MAVEVLARNTAEVELPRAQREYISHWGQAVASLGPQSLAEPWEGNDVNLLSS